jgi:hypothetical protein
LDKQDHVVERLGDVVDGAEAVTAQAVHVVGVRGGDEDDRRRARAFLAGEQRRGLEAVHVRHLHVEQDQRELVVERRREHFVAGCRFDKIGVDAGEDAPDRDEVGPVIVGDEDLGAMAENGFHRSHKRLRRGRCRAAARSGRRRQGRARPAAWPRLPRRAVPARWRCRGAGGCAAALARRRGWRRS